MSFQPLGTRILVKGIAAKRETASGIILTGGSDEVPRGLVVAVGPKVDQVKVGDTILFGVLGANPMPGMADHLILPEENVMAVIDE
jgi:co-chaperonin GroES (HSP10)